MSQLKTCNDEQLILYYYGELDAPDRKTLAVHLEGCPACQTALVELQVSLAAVPQPELKLSAAEKLQFTEKVTEKARRRSTRFLPAWGGALAAGVVMVAVLWLQPAEQLAPVAPGMSTMADFEMLEQLELLQEIELLQDLDLLQEMGTFG